jgi:peptide chain release factor 1
MKISIKKADLRFRAYRSSGPGGQHRNTTMSAIEVTHLPTGIKACASLKAQSQSKRAALRVLISRLYAHFHVQKERFGAPAERVRTYHEPDNRVTDHGSGLQLSYREVVDKGDLSRMIESRAASRLREE